jgi:hypothetical protein
LRELSVDFKRHPRKFIPSPALAMTSGFFCMNNLVLLIRIDRGTAIKEKALDSDKGK